MLKTGADSLIGIILGMLRPRRATESPLCREVAQGGPRAKKEVYSIVRLMFVLGPLERAWAPVTPELQKGVWGSPASVS